MESMKTYLFSVCGAAVISAVVNRFLGNKGGPAASGKLLTGLFLAITVLQPLASLNVDLLEGLAYDVDVQAQRAVQQGEEETKKALAQIIKDRTAEYILQKAQALRVDITAEVTVSDDIVPIPKRVYLSGTVSPYVRQQLQTMMEQELGIAKENQVWI